MYHIYNVQNGIIKITVNHDNSRIIIQLTDDMWCDQTRLALTVDQAKKIAASLNEFILKVENNECA